MNYWVMKSEPNEYSITDLERDRVQFWDGIRNYQVRNMLRDEFKKGDLALFYHSNAGQETGVVGVMEVVGEAKPDPAQFDVESKYFDPKSAVDNPRWVGVDVRFQRQLTRLVSLAELKLDAKLVDLPLVRKGNRLSVMRLRKEQFVHIVQLGG